MQTIKVAINAETKPSRVYGPPLQVFFFQCPLRTFIFEQPHWIRDTEHQCSFRSVSFQEIQSYHYKLGMFVSNFIIFMMAVYMYFRHNWYCESGGEYIDRL